MIYPICANNASLVYQKHDDIDAQAARLTGYGQSYQQLSAGQFSGAFLSCGLDDDLSLFFEYSNQGLLQSGVVPEGYYAVAILLQASEPISFNYKTLKVGSAILLPPKAEFEVISSKSMDAGLIHIATDLISYDGGELPDQLPLKVVHSNRNHKALYALINNFFQATKESHLDLDNELQLRALKQAMASVIQWSFIQIDDIPLDRLELSNISRRQMFFQARELINAKMKDIISIQTIASALRISRRTLEYVFKDYVGMSPWHYIKVLRLNNIRRELLNPENLDQSIGDLAVKWGVWHQSHFATDYYHLFGERPSQTRKNFTAK